MQTVYSGSYLLFVYSVAIATVMSLHLGVSCWRQAEQRLPAAAKTGSNDITNKSRALIT